MILATAVLEEIFQVPGPWYGVTISHELPDYNREVVLWCLETFGTDNFDSWAYSLPRDAYFFRREADRTMFILRWS